MVVLQEIGFDILLLLSHLQVTARAGEESEEDVPGLSSHYLYVPLMVLPYRLQEAHVPTSTSSLGELKV